MTLFRAAFALVMILAWSAAQASQEGLLPLTTFQLQSTGNGDTGSVSIWGSVGDRGLTELNVNAFGKHFALSAEQLQRLRGLDVKDASFRSNTVIGSSEGEPCTSS